MKRLLVLIGIVALLLISGCSSAANNDQEEQGDVVDQGEDSQIEEKIDEIINSVMNSEAQIIYSGVVDSDTYESDNCCFKIESYDLGYSGNYLSKGDEVLCIKVHFMNKTDYTASLSNLLNTEWFIDGVEKSLFGEDFYGEGTAFDNCYITDVRPGYEADLYICLECKVDTPHTIDVDITENIRGENGVYTMNRDAPPNATLSFTIE